MSETEPEKDILAQVLDDEPAMPTLVVNNDGVNPPTIKTVEPGNELHLQTWPDGSIVESPPLVSAPVDTVVVTDSALPEVSSASTADTVDEILNAIMLRIGDPTKQDPYIRTLIYGDPGAGKTVFSASSPNWLMLNVENGAKVLAGHRELITEGCDALEFRSITQINLLLDYLEKDHPNFAKYDTIILDTVNSLQDRDLDEITVHAAAASSLRQRGVINSQDGDYSENLAHMKFIIDRLCALKRHIIFTAHSKAVKDDATGIITRSIDVTPKVAKHLNAKFDLIGYLVATLDQNNQIIRNLQVHPTREVSAKTRIPGLPTVIIAPTFNTLLTAYLKGQEKND